MPDSSSSEKSFEKERFFFCKLTKLFLLPEIYGLEGAKMEFSLSIFGAS